MLRKSLFIVFVLCFSASAMLFAQGQDKTVLFNARIISATNSEYLPLAYVYIPAAGRGALSDNFGSVDLYVFPGDSVVVTYVGYKPQYYLIPRTTGVVHQAIIEMNEDSRMLSEVKVFPHASEEEFKKAFLNLRLRDEKQRDVLARNLEQSKLNVFALQAGLGANANFRNFSDMMVSSQANKSFVSSPLLSLTNPFAWMSFIKSIKNGDLKRKDWKKAYELQPKQVVSPQQFVQDQRRN
ncbi:MAG: carboxypeptidase-like regulatory domain-containing protein [Bacteroidota bacterium]|jgi:hypothetical protein